MEVKKINLVEGNKRKLRKLDIHNCNYYLGRFLCPDAMWEKYINYTPYQYAGNDPINKVDWDGKYWDKNELTKGDLKTFNAHINLMKKSVIGFQLVNFLENAPFKVSLLSREMAFKSGAVDFPLLNSKGEIVSIDVWLDYSSGGLKTTIEELVHVNQFAQSENKQKFIEDVKSEIKNKKYKDRKHEKEAKKITEEINHEIFDSISESNKLPKVIDNKLPSVK